MNCIHNVRGNLLGHINDEWAGHFLRAGRRKATVYVLAAGQSRRVGVEAPFLAIFVMKSRRGSHFVNIRAFVVCKHHR